MQKIRKGDEVLVMTGSDKGKRGKVQEVRADGRLIVTGVRRVKKHRKPNPQAGVAGGIIEQEAPIQVSNVALFNEATGKGERVGIKSLKDGRKLRFFKSNGEMIDT